MKPLRHSSRPAYRRRNLKQGAARNFCGERVRSLRRELALTQDEFAARCHVAGNWNVDRFLIAKIEAGERAVTDLELRILIKALKTTPAALIGD